MDERSVKVATVVHGLNVPAPAVVHVPLSPRTTKNFHLSFYLVIFVCILDAFCIGYWMVRFGETYTLVQEARGKDRG